MEPGHFDREDPRAYQGAPQRITIAAMEPGHFDREDWKWVAESKVEEARPRWSPVISTGKTSVSKANRFIRIAPQWSPVISTGKTR